MSETNAKMKELMREVETYKRVIQEAKEALAIAEEELGLDPDGESGKQE